MEQKINDTRFDNADTITLRISTEYENNGIPKNHLEIIDQNDITKDETSDNLYKIPDHIVTKVVTNYFGNIYVTSYYKHIQYLLSKELDLVKTFSFLNIPLMDFILISYHVILTELGSTDEIEQITSEEYESSLNQAFSEYLQLISDYAPNDVSYPRSKIQLDSKYKDIYGYAQNKNLIINDKKKLSDLIKLHDKLSEIVLPEYTVPEAKKYIRRYNFRHKLTIKYIDDNEDIGIDVFNASLTTKNIIFIRYNSGLKIDKKDEIFECFYKIYKNVDYDKISMKNTTYTDNNSIYISILYMSKIYTMKLDFINMIADIELKADVNIDNILNFISIAIPIELYNETKIKTAASFKMFGYYLYLEPFLYDVLLNKLFNSNIYIDEFDNAAHNKSRINFHMREFENIESKKSQLTFSITQLVVKPEGLKTDNIEDIYDIDEIVPLKLKIVKENEIIEEIYNLNSGYPYLLINITNSPSEKITDMFINIITRLIYIHTINNQNDIEQLYKYYVTDYNSTLIQQKTAVKEYFTKTTEIDKDVYSGIKDLKKKAPDLIVNGYPAICDKDRQPIMIEHVHLNQWLQNHPYIKDEVSYMRNVVALPETNPKYYFVCPGDEFPYVDLKKHDLPGIDKEIYPLIPCCFKTLSHRKCCQEEIKTTYKIKTNSVLESGRQGYVSQSILEFFKVIYGDYQGFDVTRLGTHIGTDSLLHCVCSAIDINYNTSIDKIEYIYKIRKILASIANINLLKQEMFDFNESEIKHMIEDPDEFLDSKYFISLVENYFNINLFIIYYINRDEDIIGFEIPRTSNKYPHITSKTPNRMNLILLKHKGSSRSERKIPQYELITVTLGDTMYGILDHVIYSTCEQIFNDACNSYILEHNKYSNNIEMRKNININIDLFNVINSKLQIEYQYIDSSGKSKMFLLSNGIIVDTIPTYPRNIPLFNPDNTELQSWELCIETFGNPSLIEVDPKEEYYVGFWFNIYDIVNGIYTPFEKIKISSIDFNDIKRSKCYVIETENSYVYRIKKLKTLINNLMQIYRWLFLIFQINGGTFDEFTTKFKVDIQKDVDSLEIYSLGNIEKYFPRLQNNTLEEALEQLYIDTKGIVINENGIYYIYMYNNKLYERVLYNLKRFYIEYYDVNIKLPTKISIDHISKDDFSSKADTDIIIGKDEFSKWIEWKLNKHEDVKIVNSIKIPYCMIRRPYFLVISRENKTIYSISSLYMIQNVHGNKMCAINVAYNWIINHKNLGYFAPEYKSNKDTTTSEKNIIYFPNYVIYGISLSYYPVILEDFSEEKENYIEILSYGGDRYAAMIRLL